jgi:GH24 family phage-related lysozyme (muramidase)
MAKIMTYPGSGGTSIFWCVTDIIGKAAAVSPNKNSESLNPFSFNNNNNNNNNPTRIATLVSQLTPWTRKIPQVTSGNSWEAEAANFIALKEGFVGKVTKKDQGTYRGGYGSDKKLVNEELQTVVLGTTFTKQEAVNTLKAYSIYFYSRTLIGALGQTNWDKLNNHQKAALVSLSYNAGRYIWTAVGYPYAKEIIAAIKADDYQAAAQGILNGPRSGRVDGYLPSLAKRRTEEAQLFLYPGNQSIY